MTEVSPVSFGALLRRLRLAKGLSQEALAEASGVSAASIGGYERGVRMAPVRESSDRLAAALRLSPAERAAFKAAANPKPRMRRTFGPHAQGAALPPAIPAEITTFVGREDEVAEVLHALEEHRVVTVVGTGGVGKTRVALRVAAHHHRADGVWFVDLSSVRDPSRVVSRIASALTLPLRDDETPEALAESLRERSALLVLDNCEHVLAPVGAVVAALVRIAPRITVLATSRHRLNVNAEFVYRLAPLPFPETPPDSARDARRYGAIALFVARAGAADQNFVFVDEHVPAVVEICRRVEGIPLAVELAAARVPMFGLAMLRKKLGERLDLLKSTMRDVPERQQTFRATIDWSFGLLEERERILLQRLAVFAGGCTLESAEDVCSDAIVPREYVIDGLSALLDQSLISADVTPTSARYHLLESTREYAFEKLSEYERRRLSAQHAAWCAAFAESVGGATLVLTHDDWSQSVMPKFDNVCKAIDWTTDNDRRLFASIVGSLYFMWWRIGRPEEGRRFAAAALRSIDEDAQPAVAAQLHLARSHFLKFDERRAAIARAVDLLEGLAEPRALAGAYLHLGGVYLMTRDRARLAPLVERSVTLVERSGERGFVAFIAWLRGGLYALEGRLNEAKDELSYALDEPNVSEQEAGYVIVHELANVEYRLGNFQRAAQLCDDLVAATRMHRLANHEMYALVKASAFHLLLGDLQRAGCAARDAVRASRQLNVIVLRAGIQLLAAVAALDGDPVRAARLHGYVDSLLGPDADDRMNLPFACRDVLVASLERQLTADEKATHMAAGSLLSETAAVNEALRD